MNCTRMSSRVWLRIAGTISQGLPAGDYAIAEAPDIFCVERRRVEEFNTIFSNLLR